MLDLLIILFVAFMVYWWATQGLFSAFIHLLLTIFAAVLALAAWEPFVLSWLINRMPEYAWGVGLLVPFGMILLALRIVFDKTIPGNVHFPHLVNLIGGGALGFASGVISVGMIVIGLQMAGLNNLLGYTGWAVNEQSQIVKKDSLIIPVDGTAAGLISTFANGSMRPVTGDATLELYHPDIAIESSLFHKSAFWTAMTESARRSMHPDHAKVMDGAYFELPRLTEAAAEKLKLPGGLQEQIVVIGTEIMLQEMEGPAAADANGVFYATPNQIVLVAETDRGQILQVPPIGFIQNGEYRTLAIEGDYVYSAPRPTVRYHWVFRTPAASEPQYLRIKQARIELPRDARNDADAVAALVTYRQPKTPAVAGADGTGTPGAPTGHPGGAVAEMARVSDQLPFTINRNQLSSQNVETEGDAILKGKARVRTETSRVGKNLSVNRIYSTGNARIVQVNLGKREAGSLLGKVINNAVTNTQAPVLIDASGETYFAIGYGIVGGEFTFDIDPSRGIRALSQLELSRVNAGDEVLLYYQIPVNTKITKFQLGGAQSQDLSLEVK